MISKAFLWPLFVKVHRPKDGIPVNADQADRSFFAISMKISMGNSNIVYINKQNFSSTKK
jgi:hypothetical protein